MSKSAFLYAASLMVVIFSLVIGTVFYQPKNPFNVFVEAELFDSRGVVIKVERLVTAERLCREQLRLRYGDDLLSMTLDKHSSHFDAQRSLFVVFSQASLAADLGSESIRFKCYVERGASRVDYMDILDANQL
jgi:hypothetical protein